MNRKEQQKTRVLVVGHMKRSTGGIQQYMRQHIDNLPCSITAESYDIGPPLGEGQWWMLKSITYTLLDVLKFPLAQRSSDVIHIHTGHYNLFYQSTFYVLISSILFQKPVILHIHGSRFDDFLETDSKWVQIIQNIVLTRSDKIIVLSDYWEAILAKRIDEQKIIPLPNAINVSRYHPVENNKIIRIIYISDLIERKGVHELIQALPEIVNEHDRIEVKICGIGPLESEVKQLDEDHTAIDYLGYISEMEKEELLSKSSIFVLPSHAEGMPIAILEAMAGGNAIIATKVGSLPELIEEQNGILIEPGNHKKLVEAVNYLISNPDQIDLMKRSNQELAKMHSWSVIGEKITKIYQNVLDSYK